jgi:hypothetical protein
MMTIVVSPTIMLRVLVEDFTLALLMHFDFLRPFAMKTLFHDTTEQSGSAGDNPGLCLGMSSCSLG